MHSAAYRAFACNIGTAYQKSPLKYSDITHEESKDVHGEITNAIRAAQETMRTIGVATSPSNFGNCSFMCTSVMLNDDHA